MKLWARTIPINKFEDAFRFFPSQTDIFQGPASKEGYRIIFQNKELKFNKYECEKLKKLRILIQELYFKEKEFLLDIQK